APTGPQGFSGSGTWDRQDGASGWPSGGSTGTAGEAPDAIWPTPAHAEWPTDAGPTGAGPSADTSPGAWSASLAIDWPRAPPPRPPRAPRGPAAPPVQLRISARPPPSTSPARPPAPRTAGVPRGGRPRTAAPLLTGSARLRIPARPALPAVAPRLPHPASGL